MKWFFQNMAYGPDRSQNLDIKIPMEKTAQAIVYIHGDAVLGKGMGNADWNNSAPHGSGRKKTRTDARSLSLDEYCKEMRGIWSSIISKDTLAAAFMKQYLAF